MATTIPTMLSKAMAAIAIPYSPARAYAPRIPTPITKTGGAAASNPTASPAMMLVAWPVWELRAIPRTGLNWAPVKYSVIATIRMVITTPITPDQKRLITGCPSTAEERPPVLERTAVRMAKPTIATRADATSPR